VVFQGQIHDKTDFKRGVSQAEGEGLKYFKPAVQLLFGYITILPFSDAENVPELGLSSRLSMSRTRPAVYNLAASI